MFCGKLNVFPRERTIKLPNVMVKDYCNINNQA